jgi:hypothetical protein
MWKLAKGLFSASALSAAGYYSYLYYRKESANRFFNENTEFLIQSANISPKLLEKIPALNMPIKSIDPSFDPAEHQITLEKAPTGLHFVRKIGDKYFTSPLNSEYNLEKWLQSHKTPYTEINTEAELKTLLKQRKKHEFLDCFVCYYVPPENNPRELFLKEVATITYFEDPTSSTLSCVGEKHIKFLKITSKALAEELGIADLSENAFLRIRDCRGWFHARRPRSAYVSEPQFKAYIDEALKTDFKVDGHNAQLQLKIFFDKFVFSNSNDPENGVFQDLKEMIAAMAIVDPLIVPLFSLKQLQISAPKVFFSLYKENAKMLLVSLKKDHDEKRVDEIQAVIFQLKLEEFARKHPEVLVVMGYPEFIYHLPIRDIAVYHYDDLEIRMIDINKGKAMNSNYLEENMSLEELLASTNKRLETSPPTIPVNSEVLTADELYEKVLKSSERCYFVMNCSKTCPACSYQDMFFQAAAAQSEKCRFAKYYVSSQSPYFKGPNATPTYHLYLPGKKAPVVYSAKENGLKPENFFGFINQHLAETGNS